MLFSAAGWLCTAYSGNPVGADAGDLPRVGGLLYGHVDLLDYARSCAELSRPRGRHRGDQRRTGNIGSALNPLAVGWLKDLTRSFSAGLIYAAVLLVIGAAVVAILPISPRRDTSNGARNER